MSSLRRYYKNSPRLRRWTRGAKDRLLGSLGAGALWAVGLVPLRVSLPLAEWLGRAVYFLLPGVGRLAMEHLDLAFGNSLTRTEKGRIACASIVNVAKSFCELARIDEIHQHLSSYVEISGFDHIAGPVAKGESVIAVTGHIGNWELLAAYFAWSGVPVAAVARSVNVDRLNRLLVDFRARQKVETILRESPNAARQILRVLKGGTVLAMLIDQDTRVQSVSVPFFGRPARTPAAAATLALRRGIAVVPVFIERRPDGGHRITGYPAVHIEATGDRVEDTIRLTAALNQAIEAQIRRCPEQWVWWHRRWRHRPEPGLDLDTGQ